MTCGIGKDLSSSPKITAMHLADGYHELITHHVFVGISSSPFDNPGMQRSHFKSDWHRFNVKLRSVKRAAVGEAEFERLVGEKDEVIWKHENMMC